MCLNSLDLTSRTGRDSYQGRHADQASENVFSLVVAHASAMQSIGLLTVVNPIIHNTYHGRTFAVERERERERERKRCHVHSCCDLVVGDTSSAKFSSSFSELLFVVVCS